MKRLLAIGCLLGLAGGCTTPAAAPYGTTYAPPYMPGPVYTAPAAAPCTCAPVAAPATTAYRAPATTYVQPVSYQQCCAPTTCCQ